MLAGVAGLAALGVTFAGAQSGDERHGFDPLSADEEQAALAAATAGGGAESTAPGGGDDVVLLVERHDEAKSVDPESRRRADVYVYSYDDDTTIHSVVDLETGAVDQTQRFRDQQLPLVASEQQTAIDLALEDAAFRRLLDREYQRASGRALTDPATELVVQPIVFLADAMPDVATGPAAACGRHRCAQLMIQTSDHVLVNLLPIVDLSEGRLIARNAFFNR